MTRRSAAAAGVIIDEKVIILLTSSLVINIALDLFLRNILSKMPLQQSHYIFENMTL